MPYFVDLFSLLKVKPEDLPSPYKLRNMIIQYSDEIYEETYNLLKSKIVSLIIDRSTSWNSNYYEISVFCPGMIKHIKLVHVINSDAVALKKVIDKHIDFFKSKNISVVGICTDNGPNLKATCDQICIEFMIGKTDTPLLHFS